MMAESVASGAPRVSALRKIPGSDRLDELVHLLRDPMRFLHVRFERHGRVFRTRFVYPCVFVVGEAANRTLMITRRAEFSFGQGYARTSVRRVFENSIMLQDGDDHDRTRAILKPAVGRLALREAADGVYRIWARNIDAVSREGADAYTLSQRTTFEVAANVLGGLELGAQTDAVRPHFERLIDGVMAPVPYRVPFGKLDRALRARRELERALAPRVLEARSREPRGLVGQLAHHRDPDGTMLSVTEIIEQLLLLAWAGYDTTASSAAWVLHVLAERPDWQQRLRRELLESSGPEAAMSEGGRELPQLEWFLLELERLHPSAPFFPRVALEDVEVEGYAIEKGTLVFYTPYMSHRDPASFDHPDVFDPERWNPAAVPRRATPSQLFGFGGGPRICLGKAFAKLQLRLAVFALLTRYRMNPDPTCRPRILGLPVHHPVNSRIRLEPLARA
jgi:retinoid hydroxylase